MYCDDNDYIVNEKLFIKSFKKYLGKVEWCAFEKGVERGILKNRIDVVFHLLRENVSLDIISRTTNFSQEFLRSISNSLNIKL